MGQCSSSSSSSNAVDPTLANSKSHLYAKHLDEARKEQAKSNPGKPAMPLPHTRGLPPSVTTTANPLEMFSYNGALMTANGQRFYLKGINWFGFESAQMCVQGLWAQPMGFLLDFLVSNGFNAIRLPLCTQTCLSLDSTTTMPSGFDTSKNLTLVGKTCGGILDIFMQQCAARGLWVMPDMHNLTIAGGIDDPLWYNSTITAANWTQAWVNIVTRYRNQWNLLGCDLKNEPHLPAAWDGPNASVNWNQAAVACGNAILAVNPRLLIFVEGTQGQNFPVEASTNGSAAGKWWGGDLSSARAAPISLNVPNKLVYSPHCYGPTVYNQPYFSASNYPANLPPIWTSDFGHILLTKPFLGPALVVGEWGGTNTGSDATWEAAFAAWLVQIGGTDQFYWCLNPTAGDTQGIIQNDWATPVASKMQLLHSVVPLPGRIAITNGHPSAIIPGNNQPDYILTTGKAPHTACNVSTSPPPVTTTASPPPTTITTSPPPTTTTTNPPPTTATFTLTSQVVSSWTDNNGKHLSQVNYTLLNTGSTLRGCSLGLANPGIITQIWNVTQTSTVSNGLTLFALPTWLQQAGGIAPGASLAFGGIFVVSGGQPSWTIVS